MYSLATCFRSLSSEWLHRDNPGKEDWEEGSGFLIVFFLVLTVLQVSCHSVGVPFLSPSPLGNLFGDKARKSKENSLR